MLRVTEANKLTILLVFVGCFFVITYMINLSTTKKIDEEGVYVVGIIYDRQPLKNGIQYSVNFTLRGRNHRTRFSTIPNSFLSKSDIVFLKVLPKNPETFIYLESNVPPCVDLTKQPKDGWVKLPEPVCK